MPRRSAISVRYSAAAGREYRAQLKRHAASAPGLDLLFAGAIRRAEWLALGNPSGFARIADDVDIRVIVVRRFPYRLLYVIRGDDLVIVAVAHTSRSVELLLRR